MQYMQYCWYLLAIHVTMHIIYCCSSESLGEQCMMRIQAMATTTSAQSLFQLPT